MKILGVKISNYSKEEMFEKIDQFLDGEGFRQIVTTNAEFILEAQNDKEFREIINSADLSVADTISIRYAFWRFGKHLKARIAGINLMWEILKIADQRNLSVFLAANNRGLSSWQETRCAILKRHPALKITGENIDCHSGLNPESIGILNQVQDDKDIVFVNFGAPKQEKFISELKNKNTNIKLAMGVGGSFDFITGKIKRAPKWMGKTGFEWLWRFILQPWRIKRIWNAVVVFPIRILLNK